MSLGRYLIDVAALLCVLGSLGVGAAAVRRYLLPQWCGAYARLAEIVTACALLVGVMEVLGTVGLFRQVPIVVGSIAVGSALRLGLTSRSTAQIVCPRGARPVVSAADAVLVLTSVAAVVVVLLQWARRSVQLERAAGVCRGSDLWAAMHAWSCQVLWDSECRSGDSRRRWIR